MKATKAFSIIAAFVLLSMPVCTRLASAADPAPITNWIVQGNIIPNNETQMAGAVSIDDYIYLIGGNDALDGDTARVERWEALEYVGFLDNETEVTSLPNATSYCYLFQTCDVSTETRTIYIAGGGWNSTGPNTPSATFATVDANGNLPANWSVSADFPNNYAPELGGGVVCDGYFYAFTGDSPSVAALTDECYYAKINSNGTLGTWQTGTPVPDADGNSSNGSGWWFPGVATIGNYIIANAGLSSVESSSGITDKVYTCHIDPSTGAMGPWVETTPLPAPRYNLGLTAVGTTLFGVGGRDSTAAGQANVWRAPFDPSTGTVGTWQTAVDAQLPDGVHYHDVVYNEVSKRLYVLGIRRTSDGAISNEAYISNALFPIPPVLKAGSAWTLYE